MRKIALINILIALAVSLSFQLLPASSATPTVTPTLSPINLSIGQTVHGLISNKTGYIFYQLHPPHNRDIVVTFKSDKLVYVATCNIFSRSNSDGSGGGGLGGGGCGVGDGGIEDNPISLTWFYPADPRPNYDYTYSYTISRENAKPINYTISVYALEPTQITLGDTIKGVATVTVPFHVYELPTQSTDRITAVLQEPRGTFLWVNRFLVSSDTTQQEFHTDFAEQEVNGSGISYLQMNYSPAAKQTHILVGAVGPYSLSVAKTEIGNANQKGNIPFVLNYAKPVIVSEITAGKERNYLRLKLNTGSGLDVALVQDDKVLKTQTFRPQTQEQTFDFSDTKFAAQIPLYIVFQLPANATRDDVQFSWNLITPQM